MKRLLPSAHLYKYTSQVQLLERLPPPKTVHVTAPCQAVEWRPFPPPVSKCLQYVKVEGEGLGFLTTWSMAHMTSQVLDTKTFPQLQRRNKTSSNCLTSRTYPSLSRTAGSAASVANHWIFHMSFGNPSKLCLLTQIWLVHLMLFSTSSLGLLCSLANHIHMMTCDTHATDHMVRSHRLSPFVFAS